MSTVRDLIKGSMRLIGVTSSGETPSADELNDGLSVLNELIDGWSTERLLIFNTVREQFLLTGNQQTYTIGVGGNFNTPRPQAIENAGILVQAASPTIELPVDILNQDQWAAIVLKDTASTIPMKLYMDDAFPLANINLWPKPSQSTSLILYSWKPLTSFATINDTVAMPPGYEMLLRFNLAVALAPEYNRQPDPIVLSGAASSKSNIKRMNSRPLFLKCDPAVLKRGNLFNWRTGE